MKQLLGVSFLFLLLWIPGAKGKTMDDAINEIKSINLPGVTIIDVQDVPAGNFTIPGKKTITNLPSFIRVAFISKPTQESNIHIELWLPKENWNGRFLGTGNGGGAGSIVYGALCSGLLRGFATANTDMGTSPGAFKIAGQLEKITDFGYRSTHEMTTASKAILELFYKKPAHHAYFFGCSTGGHQALMEAQRYPGDYNGIVVGAPGNNRTHLHASFVWNLQAVNPVNGGTPISQKKMAFLAKLLIGNSNGKDGGAPDDNFLTDPRRCKFDPKILPQCPDGIHTDSCFSAAEVATLKKLFDGPVNPRTGERIYTGLPLGGTYLEKPTGAMFILNWAFGDKFDYTKFDFDHDMVKLDSILAPLVNANDPNLEEIKKLGGKILMYSGTFDQLVPFQDALNYYERVIKKQQGLKNTTDFFRYFLIPGMSHCSGGPGLTDFGQQLSLNVPLDREHDLMTAMIDWVENKIPPDKIIASTFNCCDSINKFRLQRPVFPYPKLPDYRGGEAKNPESFKSKDHIRGGVQTPAQIYLK